VGAWFALRPDPAGQHSADHPPVAPIRLTAVRAAVVVGAYAVVGVEVMSALHVLNRRGDIVFWLLALAFFATVAALRYRRRRGPGLPLPGALGWLMVAGLVAIAGLTLTVAVAAAPDNWDSQSYHLPKVEQWAQRGSVGLYPSDFFSQAALAPGAEYLLLHLRLLTGADKPDNLVQWGAAALCALSVSRIAAQLGAGRLGQLAAAFAFGTAPMVVLQASSTQTDLVAALWAVATATFALDAVRGPPRLTGVLLLGAAAGLTQETKATGALAAWPMVALWLAVRAWQAIRSRSAAGPGAAGPVRESARSAGRLAGAVVALLAVATVIAGPFLVRLTVAYHNPLGPDIVREHSMQRHDPPALLVNAARLTQTATLVPWLPVNRYTTAVVQHLAGAVHVDPSDPAITEIWPYPLPRYAGPDEDLASYPLQVAAATLGVGYALIGRWRDRRVLGYTLACLAVVAVFVVDLKWQWYVNRLLLPALAVTLPLAGLAAEALVRRARRVSRVVATVVLLVAVVAAGNGAVRAVVFGRPRALVGDESVLTHSGWQMLFFRMPGWQADYDWARDVVVASGAHRIGFVINYTTRYEYPLWVMFRGRQLVSLASTVPGHPAPPGSSVDAIVCELPGPPYCVTVMPPGWTLQEHGHLAVALPPKS
jgi:hypothetical protein